jgi:hypothetical protein
MEQLQSYIRLTAILNFLIYEENLIFFFFYQCIAVFLQRIHTKT